MRHCDLFAGGRCKYENEGHCDLNIYAYCPHGSERCNTAPGKKCVEYPSDRDIVGPNGHCRLHDCRYY